MHNYAASKKARRWKDISINELRIFLAIVIYMGMGRRPKVRDYWDERSGLGVLTLPDTMTLDRYSRIKGNIHVCSDRTLAKLRIF